MGFIFFYLNALEEKRLETFKFLLSLQHHVRRNDNVPSGLPAKFHQNYTSDIGDTVLHYVQKFRKVVLLTEKVQRIVKILKSEDYSGLSNTRDSVLRAANVHIINHHNSRFLASQTDPHPFTCSSSDLIEDVIHYFLSIVGDLDIDSSTIQLFGDYLKNSLLSPAMMEIRIFVDFYGFVHLKNNDSKSFFKFFGCIFTLLLEMSGLEKNDSIYFILGEAERVLYKFKKTVPSFEDMDRFAKLLLSAENSYRRKKRRTIIMRQFLPKVDIKSE